MPDSGIGTPYWYEWKIGLIECLKMMSDLTIESVILQSSAFQSLDDVVVKYRNGNLINIQVKHTKNKNSYLDYSFLKGELDKWASEWFREKSTYQIEKICIVTNKPFGPNKSKGKCSISDFLSKVLPKLKRNVLTEYDSFEKAAIDWFKKETSLSETDSLEFLKILEFKNESDLEGLDVSINSFLSRIFGTDKEDIIRIGRERLFAQLEQWATSRREKEEINREDMYRILSNASCSLPSYELCPARPVFPSRIEFGEKFINIIQNTDDKIIFLQGAPGTGKTSFISYLSQIKGSIVDFRYYTYLPVDRDSPCFTDDDGYYSGKVLWSSILNQIKKKFEELNILSEQHFPLIFDRLNVNELRQFVLKYLPIYADKLGRTCYIFIDGIDHAARSADQRTSLISQLPEPSEISDNVKFVLVGQPIDNENISRLIKCTNVSSYELPKLNSKDICVLIEYEKIAIDSIDLETLSNSIISVVGNNTLNVLFAIYEIKKMNCPADYDTIIIRLKECGLNKYITRYYEWIISSITSENDLEMLELQTIFAFSSQKHQSKNLSMILNLPVINIEFILNKMNPLIVNDSFGYAPLHNDFRLYLRDKLHSNRNYQNIVTTIIDAIIKNDSLAEYKYDLLFSLAIDVKSVDDIFKFYTPDYVVNSLNYNISIDKLTDQFATVTELINNTKSFQFLHALSLVATAISNLINCVQYYGKEYQYIERQMPNFLTLSEKYILNFDLYKNNIIDDIHTLLLVNETERSNKLYTEYFFEREDSLLEMIMAMEEVECKKMGYICRYFAPKIVSQLPDFELYITFISGWLEASINYVGAEEIAKTFCFTKYDELDLYNYISCTLHDSNIDDESMILLADKLCESSKVSIHTLTEICFYLKLRRIPLEQIQNKIKEKLCRLVAVPSLDYKKHGVMCYFKSLFCLFDTDNSIDWTTLYNETLKRNHVTDSSRGYKPAHIFEELVKRIFSLFAGEAISYDELLSITIELFYFMNQYGTGSCTDFGAFEILPYIKKVFLQFFVNNPSFFDTSKLCSDLMEIFIGSDAHFYKELAYIYYISNNKSLFLQIVEHWCGANGVIWKEEYDVIEDICQSIIIQLNLFGESELSQKISVRMCLRLLGYVGHKEYSLNGLLECYKILPQNEDKLRKHGMQLLTIYDYANKMGDNRINIEDILFDDAICLGYEYVDALFEVMNSPEEFLFWRECLITALFRHIDILFSNDETLINLYGLVNTWIKYSIEQYSTHYRNKIDALNRYNDKIIKRLTDETMKAKLIALGNCSPSKKDISDYDVYDREETKYSSLLEQLKQTGYDENIESEIMVIINDPHSYSCCSLILNILDNISDDVKAVFITNVVIPYLRHNNKYGYRSNGSMSIIREIYTYFTKEDWFDLFNDVSNRIAETKLDFDLFYSIYDDLEFLSLYFNSQFNFDSVEQIFMDRCQLHYSIISSAGSIQFSSKKMKLDPNITSFEDFVNKHIGKVDIP
ncbi:MAG: dsDNA nuclease domain-containing protein [Ruminococcus sp.]|nr:dsDNA nuclease domain-containing protein [Ruminococcus sp.]